MMRNGHALSGLMVGCSVAAFTPLPVAVAPAFIALTTFAALLPDIDHPRASITQWLGPLGWLLCQGVRRLGWALMRRKHRAITHTLLSAVVVAASLYAGLLFAPVGVYGWVLPLALFCGWLTHALGDFLTISGVPLFWLPGRSVKDVRSPCPFVTGSDVEYVAYFCFYLIILVCLLWSGGVVDFSGLHMPSVAA